MKKLLILLLALALGGAGALAETETPSAGQALEVDAFVQLSPRVAYDPDAPSEGTFYEGEIDLDGDGTMEKISYTYTLRDYNYAFTLSVNGVQVTREDALYLTGELGAVRFEGVDGALLLVADNGASEDPMSYVYHYVAGEEGATLGDLGIVDAFPSDMTVTGRNTFTAYVRASTLCTWWRPADFVVAAGYRWNDEETYAMTYAVAEVPRDLYPVGAHVALKADLPLMTSRADETICRTLRAGEEAVIAATDDREWYYIVAPTDDYETPGGGWFRLAPDSLTSVRVGDAAVEGYELFDGLLYAD